MAKDFDIFLHRHLTECEILIQSIPFRDGISVTDRMILNATLQGCQLLRIASGRSDMELNARLDRMIKTCYEKLGSSVVMDASAEFRAIDILSLSNEPMELSVENIGTLVTALNRAEAGMVMSVEPLVTKIAKSLGHMDSPIILNASVTDTLKRSLLTLRSEITMDAGLTGDLKKGLLLDVDTGISMDATLDNLCSRVKFDAITGIEMTAIILGTRISHSLGRAISGITIDSDLIGTKAQKLEAADGVIQIMADMTPILIKLIYPEAASILLDAGVSGSVLKRYRLLNEMDDFQLDNFDDMTLNEVDYVIFEQ